MERSEKFLEEERRELLMTLIPAVVHRLNNSLAVISGVHEAGDPAFGEVSFRGEMNRMTETLRHLAVLANSNSSELRTFDLGEILVTADHLGTPLAHQFGVRLSVRRLFGPARKTVLRSDARRLEQLVVTLLCGLIRSVGEAGDKALPVPLRLSIFRGRGRLALSLSHGNQAADRGVPADMSDLLEAAAPWARSAGVGLSLRRMAGATCYRIAFGNVETDGDPIGGEPLGRPASATTQLLLVGSDDEMRELIQALCEDAGYRVEFLSAAVETGAIASRHAALLLLDVDVELESPGYLRRLFETDGFPMNTLLLGTPRAGLPPSLTRGMQRLKKPFRPQEFLAAVEATLGRFAPSIS